jgi:septal ring factor EnvC (AmiA/AmiB activator)
LALLVFFIAGWRAMIYESASAGAPGPPATASAPRPSSSDQEIEASPSEISGLRQEVADLDSQVQQQTLISMAANDKVQSLQSELVQAQKKILIANTDRDEAVRKTSELQAGLQQNGRDLDVVCKALRAEMAEPPRRAPAAALAACGAAAPK